MNCHIAILCNYELKEERIGGMDRFFKTFNDELVERGAEVTWFFTGNKRIDFYNDVQFYVTGNQPVESFFLEYIKSEKRFDVIITHFVELCTNFFKKVKAANKGVFTIAVDHNPRPLKGLTYKKRFKNKIKSVLYSKFTDHFVGVSQYTVDQIVKDYGNRVENRTSLIYNGIDTDRYKKRCSTNTGKFIVASHLRASKGIQDLINAVKLLPHSEKKNLKIDIYGEGPLETQLMDMVKTLSLQEIFSFQGSSSKLPDLFQNYSFLLQPTYMECFSLSILESIASNVPVVTTDVGGNTEIVEDGKNGFIFKPGDIKEFSEILNKILKNQKQIHGSVNGTVEQQYNLNKMVQNHIKIIPCI
jgi:L-malate glycosyltransferase